MYKTGWLFLLLLILSSCKKEEAPVVNFRLQLEGFAFRPAYPDTPEKFAAFTHRLSGVVLKFSGEEKDYSFNVENDSLEHRIFELPVGTYQVDFLMDQASLYGQEWGTFKALTRHVDISENTKSLVIQIEPDCAVFLVNDAKQKLDEGAYMIERHDYAYGYFTSYPLSKDPATGLYYTYFSPDTVPEHPSAFLWFYVGEPGDEEGGLSTINLENGTRYDIEILN